MQMRIVFPDGLKVAAWIGGHKVLTDQPPESGGAGEAPAPFELFLASLGTCAGYFALSFCRKRGIPTEGLELVQRVHWDEQEPRVSRVEIDLLLPAGFPDKYRDAILAAVNLCTVKRHLARPPELVVRAAERAGA